MTNRQSQVLEAHIEAKLVGPGDERIVEEGSWYVDRYSLEGQQKRSGWAE